MIVAALMTFTLPFGFGQAVNTKIQRDEAKVPAFEVISVKQAIDPQRFTQSFSDDGFRGVGISIRGLIMSAYAIPTYNYIVGEPGWTNDPRYDIAAKVSDSDMGALGKLDFQKRNSMLQQILVDRFKLQVHRAAINQPIYSLTVTKKDRLHEAAPPTDDKPQFGLGMRIRGAVRTTEGTGTTVQLAQVLGSYLGRNVVDNTGLTGNYTIKFQWTPDGADPSSSGASAPSLFTAIQEELGLKLVPATGPVECLIIDHIEPPTPN